MSRAFLTPLNASPLASNPGSGVEGDIYYNTTDDKIRYYNGSAWVDVGSGAGAVYQTTAPATPSVGQIWIDSDGAVSGLNQNDYITKAEAQTYNLVRDPHPFLLGGM